MKAQFENYLPLFEAIPEECGAFLGLSFRRFEIMENVDVDFLNLLSYCLKLKPNSNKNSTYETKTNAETKKGRRGARTAKRLRLRLGPVFGDLTARASERVAMPEGERPEGG